WGRGGDMVGGGARVMGPRPCGVGEEAVGPPRGPRYRMSPPRKRGPIVRAEARRRGEVCRVGGRGHSVGHTSLQLFLERAMGPRLRGGDMWGVGRDPG